ncbi:patatin-like phospholipase family protein [Bosea sp. PAMC 26642]|uniref:patatin-like phospholipase family protein n=1 Tax=Bosea sp. (strain PAMC 26642) TaxID=1792307 RepID=UPI000A784F75|nr:patatin-like phospholipase family protein [Bosea sp. PAMC 26642]
MTARFQTKPADFDKKVGLVLQGGGALGSYQAGVYKALAESGYHPDWIAGISIGAINGAIIAGNAPAERVSQLRGFWERVTAPTTSFPFLPFTEAANRRWHAASALLFGRSGFFGPRPMTDWFGSPVSFYETKALRSTLEAFIDFDRLNAGDTRFSVAAANVRTGDFAYFDSREITIQPEHVMASAALPPGFPPVEIDGEHYWDGGLVSNTPLQYVLDYVPRRSRLTFQVDVFNAEGPLPSDLESAMEREKDIRYSSRTRTATDMARVIHDVRHNINDLIERLPDDLRASKEAQFLYEFGCVTRMDIVRLSYRPAEPQGQSKDYEFSATTMAQRWDQGLLDARATLAESPWLVPMPSELGARVFDGGWATNAPAQTSLMAPSRPAAAEPG